MNSDTRYRHLMRSALRLAERGMHVFPLRPRTKLPAVDRDWESRATTDPDVIGRWWTAAPYNVGVACGPAGLLVVDLDAPRRATNARADPPRADPHGRLSLAAVARAAGTNIPRGTFTVVTPGGGQHLYFRAPQGIELRNTVGRLGRHIDTRAAGGYVVGPGSVVPRGRYRLVVSSDPLLLPNWIRDGLRPPPVTRSATGIGSPRRVAAYVQAAVRGEVERVTVAPVGRRNHALFRASARLGTFVAAGTLTEADARSALSDACTAHLGVEGFDAGEARRTIDSGFRHGGGHRAGPVAQPRAASPSPTSW